MINGQSIQFGTTMQLANLSGKKSRARLLLKSQPFKGEIVLEDAFSGGILIDRGTNSVNEQQKASFKIGELVPVVEHFQIVKLWPKTNHSDYTKGICDFDFLTSLNCGIRYVADLAIIATGKLEIDFIDENILEPKLMSIGLSRSSIKITGIYFQRLNDIKNEDCEQEGFWKISKDGEMFKYGLPDRDGYPGIDNIGWPWKKWCNTPLGAFKKHWNDCNKYIYKFSDNPWVEVIEYEFLDFTKEIQERIKNG